MLIIGLLLVVLSAASVALLLAYNNSGGPEQTIVMFGRDWVNVSPLDTFIAGMAIALVFCLGVWMVVSTERRRREVRSQWREARREARQAARERDHLAKQLEHERTEHERLESERLEAERTAPPVTASRDTTSRATTDHGNTVRTVEPQRPSGAAWTAPEDGRPVAEPQPEPRRSGGIGRHFRRAHRNEETPTEQTTQK